MPAIKAPFGTGVPLVNLDEGSSIPLCFVVQLSHKLTPSHIRDGLRETVVLDHILDRKALNTDHLVFVYQFGRELVLVVPPTVGNSFVDTSDLQTGLRTVLGAFVFLGMPPLCFC